MLKERRTAECFFFDDAWLVLDFQEEKILISGSESFFFFLFSSLISAALWYTNLQF